MDEGFLFEMAKIWGPVILVAPVLWKFFVSREKSLLESQEKRDAAREEREKQYYADLKKQEEDRHEELRQYSEKLISIVEQTTAALTTISQSFDEFQKTAEKLQNIVEQLRYLRMFLEKVMRVRDTAKKKSREEEEE